MTTRRDVLNTIGGAAALSALPGSLTFAQDIAPIKKAIPSTGEEIPIMGVGSSRTFDVGEDQEALAALTQVMQIFFDQGGGLIDSSPMYGTSESVIGELLRRVTNNQALFAATKVWINGEAEGIAQMKQSSERMGVETMDLMQIHNLRDWKTHLKTLRAWKDQGKIRYIGITTSHGRFHDVLSDIMKTEPLDFVQFSYSIDKRNTEANLFPIAQDKGIATLINRPFQKGATFKRVQGKSLPDWAGDIGVASWAQYFLKFAASHPSATCVIPATTDPDHMADNMQAGLGILPDDTMRAEMVNYFEAL